MSSIVHESRLWVETPLVRSSHISNLLGCSAYLKLENIHPSQSFKYRGISLFAQYCKARYGPLVHLIIASGGNAGLAAACAANVLRVRCTVYIPEGISQRTMNFLTAEGADVVVGGKCYLQALTRAEEAVKSEGNAVMVPAYDHPVLWQGHASMIHEIAAELPNKPDAVFCSVGGGGLLGGIIVGCKDAGWDDVPIIALETHGSNCFYHSISINPGQFNAAEILPEDVRSIYDDSHDVKLAHMTRLTSRASSLGASSPAPGVVKMSLERVGGVRCVSVPDELSMRAAMLFAEDHKMLAELACSTTLTPAYNPGLFAKIMSKTSSRQKEATVVFVVCGGFKTSLEEMEEWRNIIGDHVANGKQDVQEVLCHGERWNAEADQ